MVSNTCSHLEHKFIGWLCESDCFKLLKLLTLVLPKLRVINEILTLDLAHDRNLL